jgi:thiosulfate/3-mercaptopyruvate sulfurtransferase
MALPVIYMDYRTLIDCAALAAGLDAPELRLFDCRFNLADTRQGQRHYATGHIPGAYYAHLERDLSGPISADSGRHPLPEVERLRAWLEDHGVQPTTQVIAYDDSGGSMAVRLWWLLRWMGHPRVALLDGGLQAWEQAGLPLTAEHPRPPASHRYSGHPDWDQVVTTAEVVRELANGSPRLLLLDARTEERFRGAAEPIDPVAGHIPGAANLPLQQNLAADGSFRSGAVLRALYAAKLAGHPPSEVAVMCGSGVTACHNLLAMELAGLPGGRLYAGSWSEWIRDPARPVAEGA